MRIELYGIARARAGRESVDVRAATFGEALRALAEACPGLVPEVIRDGRLTGEFLCSRNGAGFLEDESAELDERDTLLVLGAQSGG